MIKIDENYSELNKETICKGIFEAGKGLKRSLLQKRRDPATAARLLQLRCKKKEELINEYMKICMSVEATCDSSLVNVLTEAISPSDAVTWLSLGLLVEDGE